MNFALHHWVPVVVVALIAMYIGSRFPKANVLGQVLP